MDRPTFPGNIQMVGSATALETTRTATRIDDVTLYLLLWRLHRPTAVHPPIRSHRRRPRVYHDTLYFEGVPSAARKLIIEMEPYQTPDDAVAAHPDWFQHRFPNGEWIFGYGIDSHGFKVGHGTLVIKDSRGRTRVFFGHVCGTNAGFPESMRYAKTLDDMEKDGYFASVLREWFP